MSSTIKWYDYSARRAAKQRPTAGRNARRGTRTAPRITACPRLEELEHRITPSLVAYYPLNETSGTTAADASGNGYDATLFNNVSFTSSGKVDGGLSFNGGTNDYAAIHTLHYNTASSISQVSVAIWFKSTDTRAGIVDFDRSEYWSLGINFIGTSSSENGHISWSTAATAANGGIKDTYTTTALNDGAWHHIVAVYDSSQTFDTKIYVDGVLDVQADNYATGVNLGTGLTRYGFLGDGSEATSYNGTRNMVTYAGQLDEVRIYDQALTPSEVTTLYNFPNPPTDISLSSNSVPENQPVGTFVGNFSTTDPDSPDSHTYSLVTGMGDTGNGSFQIVGNQLLTNASFDYETQNTYSIRVRTTDAGGLTYDKVFTINITNVNEAPTDISLSSNSVPENQPAGTFVGNFSTTDPDFPDSHTYSLVSGAGDTDNGSFQISFNQLRTNAVFNYEAQTTYSIRVRTTDAGGLTYEKVFTINITNINEAPTDITLSNSTVLENRPAGTLVGTLSSVDPDAGDTHTYSLVAGTGDSGNGSFQIVGNQLLTNASFNYEAQNAYSIRVRTTDAGGLAFEKVFTITIGNVSELYAVGAAAFGGPHVKVYNGDGSLRFSFYAYDRGFVGGVRVAMGDVTGDGVDDIITGAGLGGGPHVKVFDGATGALVRSFFAFSPLFTGGIYVAAGDINSDGRADIIVGAGFGGGPHVRVFDGLTGVQLRSFFAFAPSFRGGVRVAAGDVNGDKVADIITAAGPGGGAQVTVFSGADQTVLSSFLAYGPSFTGGVFVASGDVNGDGVDEVITSPGPQAGPHVKVFNGTTAALLDSFFAYGSNMRGSVRVAAVDVNGDGSADILTSVGPGRSSHAKFFDGPTTNMFDSFFAFEAEFIGGAFVG